MTKAWEMNATQKDFMDTLRGFDYPVTLIEIEARTGKTFKTGTINTLVTKELVKTEDVEVEYKETKLFKFDDKELVTEATKTVTRKAYRLA